MKHPLLKTPTDKNFLFQEMPITQAVATMAIPTVLSSLVMVIYNLADTYFVGLLNNPIQTAAVTLASPMLLAFNAANNLLGIGVSGVMSRALGKGQYDTIRNSSAIGFYGAILCGGLFSFLCAISGDVGLQILGAKEETMAATRAYLQWTVICGAIPAILSGVMTYLVRAEGSAMYASIGSMSGCMLNIILDPIFILPWGFNMGASGAGLATFFSNCVSCAYFLVLLKCKPTYISIRPSSIHISRPVLTEIFGVGIPAAIQNLLNVISMTVLNQFTAVHGPDAVAAMGIAQRVYLIPFYIAVGGSQGVMPLISYNYAQGNAVRLKKVSLFSMRIAVCFMTVVAIGYAVGARPLIAAFMDDQMITFYGATFLRILCLALPFLGADFFMVANFQACNMGKTALIFAVLRKVVLEVPLLYLMNRIFPLYGLPFAQVFTEIVLSIAGAKVLSRLFHLLQSGQS